jgi:hypothetical protein
LASNFKVRSIKHKNDVIAYWNGGPGFKHSGKGWVSRRDVTDAGKLIDSWKVFIGKAYGDRGGGGASRDAPPKAVLGRPFVGEPGSVCTETYLCIGPFKSESEAENVCSYISCKLTRFLVMLQKPSQSRLQSASGEEREHAAACLLEIAKQDPDLLDKTDLVRASAELQRIADSSALEYVRMATAKAKGGDESSRYKYGL